MSLLNKQEICWESRSRSRHRFYTFGSAMLLLGEAVVQRSSVKKVFLEVSQLKKSLWHRCFPVNFAKFLRTLFSTDHLRWLLLYLTICTSYFLVLHLVILFFLESVKLYFIQLFEIFSFIYSRLDILSDCRDLWYIDRNIIFFYFFYFHSSLHFLYSFI